MFQGFSEATIDFMWGIRFNNEKVWFEAHKAEYQENLYEPMKALNRQVYAAVSGAHPDLGLIAKVSRIYRDARRLHGNGPYKDHLWMSMERPSEEEWTCHPSFWFELQPEGYTYGMGYYMAPASVMAKFRTRLDRDPKPFEKLVRSFHKQTDIVLNGQDYKRPKGESTALLAPWYNKRSFYLSCDCPLGEEVYSPALADKLIAAYETMVPIYEYFISVESDPDPREP